MIGGTCNWNSNNLRTSLHVSKAPSASGLRLAGNCVSICLLTLASTSSFFLFSYISINPINEIEVALFVQRNTYSSGHLSNA